MWLKYNDYHYNIIQYNVQKFIMTTAHLALKYRTR